MSKLLFVVFNHTIYNYQGMYTSIATISSLLKQHNHETDLFIVRNYIKDNSKLLLKIKDFNPDLIGFSIMSTDYRGALNLAKNIKKNFSIKIIMGGIHVTLNPIETIKNSAVDYICLGEGEYPTVELMNKLKTPFKNIPNIWYKKNNKIIKNSLRKLNDLNNLPSPDTKLFFKKNSKIVYLTYVSTGCPYNCSFCYNNILKIKYKGLGQYNRFKFVDKIINELKKIKTEYDVEKIIFSDDTFTYNKKWIEKFCVKYAQEIKIPFVANARIDSLDKDILILLKNANCQRLMFGIESGNQKIRNKILYKNISNSKIIKILKLVKQTQIEVEVNFIVGIPGENKKMMKSSYYFAKKLPIDIIKVTNLIPFPKTQIWNICKKKNLIKNKNIPITYQTPKSCLNYSQKQLNSILKYHKKLINLNTYKKYDFFNKHKSVRFIYYLLKLLFGDYLIETTYHNLKYFIFNKIIK